MFNHNTIQLPGMGIFNNRPSTSVAPIFTVASLQEVQAAQPNYDGTPSFFYVMSDRTIVVKQMDLSGLVVLKTYKEVPPNNTTQNATNSTNTSNATTSVVSDATTSVSQEEQTPTHSLKEELSKLVARIEELEKSFSVMQMKGIKQHEEEKLNGYEFAVPNGTIGNDGDGTGSERRKSELF